MVKHRQRPTWILLLTGNLPPGTVAVRLLGSVVADFEHPLGIKEPKLTVSSSGSGAVAGVSETAGSSTNPIKHILAVSDSSVKHVLSDISDSIARARLSQLLRLNCNEGHVSEETLISRTVVTRTLEDYDVIWKDLVANHEYPIKDMIRRYGRREGMSRAGYMVVGVKTCFAADLKEIRRVQSCFDVGVNVPLKEAFGAVGIDLGDAAVAELGVDLKMEQVKKMLASFTADEERVFAIQYRTIKTRSGWRLSPRDQAKKEPEMGDLAQAAKGRGIFKGAVDLTDDEDDDDDEDEDDDALIVKDDMSEGFVTDDLYATHWSQ